MNKKLLTIALLVVMLIAMTSVVTAASFTVGVKADKTEIKAGDEIVVTLSVSNIDKGNNDGIAGIDCTINFDSNVLTYVSSSAVSGWGLINYSEEEKSSEQKFMISRTNTTTDNQDVMNVTFKVNDNISVTSTEIKATGIKASFSQDEDITISEAITAADASITLKVATQTGIIPGTTTPTPTNNVAPGTQTPTVTSNVLNANQSDKTIPQTGVSDVILVVIAALAVVTVISYVRYKKV